MKNPIAPNTKIRILSEEHCEYVQKLAFDAGFEWQPGGKSIIYTDSKFLFFKGQEITRGYSEGYFVSCKEVKEIFIDLPTEAGLDGFLASAMASVEKKVKDELEKIKEESTKKTSTNKGQKHDTDKPRYDLMPVHAEAAVVDVLTFGANKYAPNNWRHVDGATERYTAAALRHIAAYRMGEHEDQESGLPHLAHAVCCLMFMLELESEADK